MNKYKIHYQYITEGWVELEAKSVAEAKEEFGSADLDCERVVKTTIKKVEKIK